jgi:hypothetical protein
MVDVTLISTFGTNPCSEIILRGPKLDKMGAQLLVRWLLQLSECVVRATDSIEDIERKVKLRYNPWYYPVYAN